MTQKITNKIALIAMLALLIIVFVLSVNIFRYAKETAVILYSGKQELMSMSVADHFENFLEWMTIDLQQGVDRVCRTGMETGQPDVKEIYQELVGKPSCVEYIDCEGIVNDVYPYEQEHIGICVKGEDTFTRTRECLMPQVSSLYRTARGDWAFGINIPVVVDGRFCGVVRAPFPVRDGVGGRVEPPWKETLKISWLIDQQGRVMFSSDKRMVGESLLDSISKGGSDEEIRSLRSLIAGKGGSQVIAGPTGEREYVTYKPIQLAKGESSGYWGLAVSVPESEIIASVRWIFVGIGMLFIVAMTVTLGGSMIVLRQKSRAQEKMEKTNESLLWFSHALKAINEGVVIVDLEGSIRFANDASCRILDKSHQEMITANVREIFARSTPHEISEFILNRSNEKGFSSEIWFRTESGENRPLFLTSSVIDNEKGNPYLRVVAFLDIRKLKEAEGELERRLLELESHMYTISHDLKSPLVTIRGYLDIFLRDCGDKLGAEDLDLISRIKAAAMRMTVLIEQIVELSKVGLVLDQSQKIPVKKVIDIVKEYLKEEMARKGIRFSSSENFPLVYADPERLSQVLDNLISNAIKFIGDKAGEPVIRVGWEEDEKDYIFYVSDNGVGIDPKIHNKIFDPFFRLRHQDAQGSGIGLAIVKRVVEQHGGRVWVESTPGKGSAFFFTLPKIPPPRV